jgi:hypothetical protein
MRMVIPVPRSEDDTRFWTREELEGMTTEEIINYLKNGGPTADVLDDEELSCLLWVLHKRAMAIHALIASILKNYLESGKERSEWSRREFDRRVTADREFRILRDHWWSRVGKWLRICRA